MTIIKRTKLSFEDRFTKVPNNWVRDTRLSRKARGMLIEILSHSQGWVVTEASLVDGGPEGRDAVRSGLTELVELGYLERAQTRSDDGTFAEATLELADPWTGYPATGDPQEVDGLSVAGLSVAGQPASIRRPFLKKTNTQEDQENTLFDSDETNRPNTKGDLLSDAWEPNLRHADLAASFGADLHREVVRFREHAVRTHRRAKNWNSAFTNWLRKGAEMSQQRAASGGQVQRRGGTAVEQMAERARAMQAEGVQRELSA